MNHLSKVANEEHKKLTILDQVSKRILPGDTITAHPQLMCELIKNNSVEATTDKQFCSVDSAVASNYLCNNCAKKHNVFDGSVVMCDEKIKFRSNSKDCPIKKIHQIIFFRGSMTFTEFLEIFNIKAWSRNETVKTMNNLGIPIANTSKKLVQRNIDTIMPRLKISMRISIFIGFLVNAGLVKADLILHEDYIHQQYLQFISEFQFQLYNLLFLISYYTGFLLVFLVPILMVIVLTTLVYFIVLVLRKACKKGYNKIKSTVSIFKKIEILVDGPQVLGMKEEEIPFKVVLGANFKTEHTEDGIIIHPKVGKSFSIGKRELEFIRSANLSPVISPTNSEQFSVTMEGINKYTAESAQKGSSLNESPFDPDNRCMLLWPTGDVGKAVHMGFALRCGEYLVTPNHLFNPYIVFSRVVDKVMKSFEIDMENGNTEYVRLTDVDVLIIKVGNNQLSKLVIKDTKKAKTHAEGRGVFVNLHVGNYSDKANKFTAISSTGNAIRKGIFWYHSCYSLKGCSGGFATVGNSTTAVLLHCSGGTQGKNLGVDWNWISSIVACLEKGITVTVKPSKIQKVKEILNRKRIRDELAANEATNSIFSPEGATNIDDWYGENQHRNNDRSMDPLEERLANFQPAVIRMNGKVYDFLIEENGVSTWLVYNPETDEIEEYDDYYADDPLGEFADSSMLRGSYEHESKYSVEEVKENNISSVEAIAVNKNEEALVAFENKTVEEVKDQCLSSQIVQASNATVISPIQKLAEKLKSEEMMAEHSLKMEKIEFERAHFKKSNAFSTKVSSNPENKKVEVLSTSLKTVVEPQDNKKSSSVKNDKKMAECTKHEALIKEAKNQVLASKANAFNLSSKLKVLESEIKKHPKAAHNVFQGKKSVKNFVKTLKNICDEQKKI
jgi:hypothetical protein